MAPPLKSLILIRGLPGSGKTTLAQALIKFYGGNLLSWDKVTTSHFEADMFFYRSGTYQYDPKLLATAHSCCYEQARLSMEQNTNVVIVSNTFVRLWELEPYTILAATFGYSVQEIVTHASFQNVHGVTPAHIERMRKHFQIRPSQYVLGGKGEAF